MDLFWHALQAGEQISCPTLRPINVPADAMGIETNVKVAHQLQICLVQGFVLNTQLLKLLGAWEVHLVKAEAYGKLRHFSHLMQGQPQFHYGVKKVPLDRQ